MNEQQSNHSRRMRWARLGLRAIAVVGLLIAAAYWGDHCFEPSTSRKNPSAENFTLFSDTDGSEEATPARNLVATEGSFRLQLAQSAILLSLRTIMFGVLIWGIVTIVKHDD